MRQDRGRGAWAHGISSRTAGPHYGLSAAKPRKMPCRRPRREVSAAARLTHTRVRRCFPQRFAITPIPADPMIEQSFGAPQIAALLVLVQRGLEEVYSERNTR